MSAQRRFNPSLSKSFSCLHLQRAFNAKPLTNTQLQVLAGLIDDHAQKRTLRSYPSPLSCSRTWYSFPHRCRVLPRDVHRTRSRAVAERRDREISNRPTDGTADPRISALQSCSDERPMSACLPACLAASALRRTFGVHPVWQAWHYFVFGRHAGRDVGDDKGVSSGLRRGNGVGICKLRGARYDGQLPPKSAEGSRDDHRPYRPGSGISAGYRRR